MALPTVSVPPTLTVKEGSKLVVPLTKTGTGPCQVQVVTGGNTAVSMQDYIGYAPPWKVSFGKDQSSAEVVLTTLADTSQELPETVTLWVNDPVGCTIKQGKCVVTIEDVPPESVPVVSLPESLTVLEGKALEIPITKSGPGPCSLQLKTTGQSARTLEDYIGYEPQLPIQFGADDTVKTAELSTLPDTLLEGAETLTVSIQETNGCKVGQGVCTVTIEDTTLRPVDPVDPEDPIIPDETDPVDPPEEPTDPLPDPEKAKFPRAIGFATGMAAGEGKSVYRVTNLNDSGPGSLREAVGQGNRLVVFEVSGCIRLKSHVILGADNITIAGQTAPGAGITVQGKEIQAKATNLRVQHIAFERGYDPSNLGNCDVAKVSPGSDVSTWKRGNIHFDHCSFLWGLDETLEIWPAAGRLSNVSFTECIFAEPLYKPQKLGFKPHEKVSAGRQSEHNYGMIIGFNTDRVDVQNCLFSDMYMRCPFIDHGTSVVLNNIILMNVRQGATIQQNRSPAPRKPCLVNAQGILMISGPNHAPDATGFRFHSYHSKWPAGSAVTVGPMYGWKAENSSITPGTKVTFSTAQPTQGSGGAKVFTGTPAIQPPNTTVKALSADGIYQRVLLNAGPMPKAKDRCPSVARVINKLKTKKPGWVDHESQVGGFSKYPSITRKLEDATLPDGTKIPLPKWSDTDSVRKWLDIFTSLVSYD